MRFMQIEPATFLVGEKGLDPKAFCIYLVCLICRGHIGDQIERVCRPFAPATEEEHRAIGGFSHAYIWERDQRAGLDTGGDRLAPEAFAVPQDKDVTPCPHHIGPMVLLHRVLQPGPIKFAIAEQDYLGLGWYP